MTKLFMAPAALTIAIAAAPGFVGTSEAASAKSPYCGELSKAAKNLPSWNEHYGCLKPAQRQAFAGASPRETAAARQQMGPKSEYCKIAQSQKNAPQWNDYYRCR